MKPTHHCTLCGAPGHRAHACPKGTMQCLGCGRVVQRRASGYCPVCGPLHQAYPQRGAA